MVKRFGIPVEIPLVSNGETVEVKNDNVEEYMRVSVNGFSAMSVDVQFAEFVHGFRGVFSGDLIECFEPDELDILVSREEVFD
jgi:hypothetical protein